MAAQTSPSLDELRARFVSQLSPQFALDPTDLRTEPQRSETTDPFTLDAIARILEAIGPELLIDAIQEAFDGDTVTAIAEALRPSPPPPEDDEPPEEDLPPITPPSPSVLISAAVARRCVELIRQSVARKDFGGWFYWIDNLQPAYWAQVGDLISYSRYISDILQEWYWIDGFGHALRPEPLKPAVQAVDQLITFARDSSNG